jgi:uncharacterized membrane protein
MGTFVYICLVFLVTHQDPHSTFIPQISLIMSWVLVVLSLRRHRWFAAFFAFGATMCALTSELRLFPGTALDSLWHLNPDAHLAFQSIES